MSVITLAGWVQGQSLRFVPPESIEVSWQIMRASDRAARYTKARGSPLADAAGNMVKLTSTTFDITRWVTAQNSDVGDIDSPNGQLHDGAIAIAASGDRDSTIRRIRLLP